MENDLSAKAYGILVAIFQHNLEITIDSLVRHFNGEKRTAIQSGLKELKLKGYLVSKSYKTDRHPITVTKTTEKAARILFGLKTISCNAENLHTASSNEQIKQNKTYSTFISKPSTSTESMEQEEFEEMPYEFFPSNEGISDDATDPKKRRQAIEENKKKKHDKKKEKTRVSRYEKRHKNPISDWSYADLGFEFADRIFVWNVAPWSVTQSRFIATLADTCRRLDINAEVVHASMELFFKQINLSEYKDGETLWRLFIHRLPGLVGQAKLSMHTEESDEVAKEAFALAMKRLRGE